MKKRIWFALIASNIAVPGLLNRAVAQPLPASPPPITTQIAGPALAVYGEHLLFCMDGHHLPNVATTATLQIVNSVTGGIVGQKVLSWPGSVALPPDPCIEFVVPAASTVSIAAVSGAASRSLYTGLVSLNPQPLPPNALATSLHVYTLGFGGIPTNVRYIPSVAPCPPGEEPCVYSK